MAGPTGASSGQTKRGARPAPAKRAAAAAPAARVAPVVVAEAPVVAVPVAPVVAATPIASAEPRAAASQPALPVVVNVPALAPPPTAPREVQALFYGALVVLAGFAAILVALAVVLWNIKTGPDATAILGVVTTAIAGLGGAFFGITVGQQGTATANKERATAEAAKDAAQTQTIRFAAHMDPAVARRLVG